MSLPAACSVTRGAGARSSTITRTPAASGSACRMPANAGVSALTYIDQKRVELARALASDPKILLLDEWLAGLNPTELKIGIALIEQLRTEGCTIIIVEHVMHAIRSLCDRCIVMNSGDQDRRGNARRGAGRPRRHPRLSRRRECLRPATSRCFTAAIARWKTFRRRCRKARSWSCLAPMAPARAPSCAPSPARRAKWRAAPC